jgi:class 3 adenylate cyclase
MTATGRLCAILDADVAGYSRLMCADEEATHERLKAHLAELANPKIEEHRGRIVKNTGDGFLAEFPSGVNAVRCAVEVERGMTDRDLPPCHRCGPNVSCGSPAAVSIMSGLVRSASHSRPIEGYSLGGRSVP